ncbi:MAG: phage tail fiber protein [Streptosporangiales bacterium]
MATFAPAFRTTVLAQGAPGTAYIATNTADPGATGASESGGARQQATFAAASAHARTASQVTAAVPSGTTVTHYSVWDAATGGNFLFGGALPSPQTADFPLTVTLKD